MTAIDNDRAVVCLDADVLIYAAVPAHPLGPRILSLFDSDRHHVCGSTLLLPEVLTKPRRADASTETDALEDLIGRIELWPASQAVCDLAVALGATYGLATVDSVHLATAVEGGADAFLTNNQKDFDQDAISEIDVLFPADLA